MKSFFLISLFFFLSSLLCFVFLLVFLFVPSGQKPGKVEIKVDRGEPFSSVMRALKEKEVIPNERVFSLWARLLGVDKKIHWGFYIFELPVAPHQILNQMLLGKGVFRRITIPEGLTVSEIADLLDKAGIADKERFLTEAENPALLSLLQLEGGLEGYLFPDTYYFTPFTTEKDIIIAMVEQFRQVFNPQMAEQSKAIGLSLDQVVTLASLIEKETGFNAERSLISGVFHNRLKLGIPLQSDPTVIYGLKGFSGALTHKDLQSQSPYNTYRIHGLPPAPICNPGLSSLMAALRPTQVPYLYFVSKNDGSHLFSASLQEHNRAVRVYQAGKRRSLGR